MRSATICLTIHMFGQGGTDRVCAYLARGFAEAGFDTEIVVLRAGGNGEAMLRPLLGDAVRVTYLGRTGGPRWLDLIRRLPALVAHIRRTRPDCIVSTGNNMNWITTIARGLAGRRSSRLVLKMTNPIVRPHDRGLKLRLRSLGYRHAFAHADRVLALSEAEAEGLRRDYPAVAGRFAMVFNPYVTPGMLQTQSPRCPLGTRLVIGIGRFQPQKRLDLLIRAFARVETASARLVVLGDGAGRPQLQALIRELGLQDRVELAGFVTDVQPWLARADLFVLPSAYEGLPAVVLEAMATNCPVISTDCFASARELIDGCDSCAIVAADPDAMAAAIDRSLTRPRPTALHAVARDYAIGAAVASHVRHVRDIIGQTEHA